MTIATVVLQSLAAVVVANLLWRLLHQFFVKSPLDRIPGPPPMSFWTGHLEEFFGRHGTPFQRHVALDYGPIVKMQGLFGKPMLYVRDPRALYAMLLKDKDIYDEEELFVKTSYLLFGPALAAVLGGQHRKQRKILNPVFSIANMRHLTPMFYSISEKLRDAIKERVRDGPREVDILNWMGRAALELIAQGGLGVSLDPLTRDSSDAFADAVKALVPTAYQLNLLRNLLLIPGITEMGPAWFRRWLVEMLPSPQLKKMTYIVDTLIQKAREIYSAKKAAIMRGEGIVSQQVGDGKDMINILMRANTTASEAERLSEDEIIAQISAFIFAAMDTTSNALTKILERLAQEPAAQERLRQEASAALSEHCQPSYDDIMRLPFLDAVIRETLRVDPPAVLVIRQPVRDAILPLSEPIRDIDGKMMHEVPLPKGIQLIVGVQGSNLSKALWGDDAEEWKPERWLSPLPSAVTEASIPGVYSNLMTFLGGGRSCIGFKFSELEMKVVLSVLLTTFKFELTDKPIVWNVASVRYPTVGTESNTAEMPMKVSLV